MKFAVILLVCDGQGGGAEAQDVEFNSFAEMGVKTLIQARNAYIHESRKDWRERNFGEGSAIEAVGKITTQKPYAGFAWQDDPCATVFVPEASPFYALIQGSDEEQAIDILNKDDKAEDLWQAVFYGA